LVTQRARESDVDAKSAISAMKPHSLRHIARRIRETASEMAHSRSREIGEKIALDLEKKAAELEQQAQESEPSANAPRDED
jgi:hypothetical protein